MCQQSSYAYPTITYRLAYIIIALFPRKGMHGCIDNIIEIGLISISTNLGLLVKTLNIWSMICTVAEL